MNCTSRMTKEQAMNNEQPINELAKALAAAQSEIEDPHKGKTAKAGSYSYNYADIADVLKVVRKALSKHHIAVVQPTIIEGGIIIVRTRLLHSSGQYIESDYPVCSIVGDHQKMGSAMTYARRYALCSLVGVAADEDMDGQDAANSAAPKAKPTQMESKVDVPKGKRMETKADLYKYMKYELDRAESIVNVEDLRNEFDAKWRGVFGNQTDAGFDEMLDSAEAFFKKDDADLDQHPITAG